ncbi:MAG: hypothetical protein U0835_18545 [Isosphaeraceae bacterium]
MSDAAMPFSPNGTAISMDAALGAARQGASDAREAADRFAANAGRFAARFIYTTCYTVSYGVVFPAVMIARSVPRNNAAVRGLTDGASAASRKVDELVAGPGPVGALEAPGDLH